MKLTSRNKNTKDARGRIMVRIVHTDNHGHPVKGNISKNLTVLDAKVSEMFDLVYDAVLNAIDEEG